MSALGKSESNISLWLGEFANRARPRQARKMKAKAKIVLVAVCLIMCRVACHILGPCVPAT